MTIQEAKQHQDELQTEAHRLILHYKLEDRLAKIGRPILEGSVASGLMVKPDIDYTVLVKAEPPLLKIVDLAKELLIEGVERVGVNQKYWKFGASPGRPHGVFLGMKPEVNHVSWNFDIWFQTVGDREDKINFPINWYRELTSDQRDDILLLKWNLKEKGLYGVDFHSADVYRAVLNDRVKTVEELIRWRKRHPYY